MSEGDLDGRLRDELGRLTVSPPGEFVAARTARAKELKAADQAELARALAGQRRPTVPAWAADQLAHRHADALDELFTAADEVRRTQSATDLDRTAVREATGTFTAVVRRLRSLAGERLAELGTAPDSHLDEVEATLLAAATDEAVAADLRAGALLRPAPSPGFAALASLSAAGRSPTTTDAGPVADEGSASSHPAEGDDEDAAAREASEARRAREAELTAERERSEAEAASAAREADEARRAAAELRADAAHLEERAARCDDDAARADETAERARRAASAAAEELAALDDEEARTSA